eukprot:gene4494-32569_t
MATVKKATARKLCASFPGLLRFDYDVNPAKSTIYATSSLALGDDSDFFRRSPPPRSSPAGGGRGRPRSRWHSRSRSRSRSRDRGSQDDDGKDKVLVNTLVQFLLKVGRPMQLSDFLTDFFAKHPELKKFKRYIQEHVIQDHSRIFEMKALSNGQHQIGLIVASCSTGGNRSGDGGNEGRPGDWVCPDSRCAELNFAFRDVCRQCPKRKPADNSQTPRSRLTSRPRSRPRSPSPARHQSRKQSSNGSSSKRSDVKVAGVKQEQPASPAATAGVVLKTAEREKRKRSSNTGSVVECKPHQEKEKGGGSDQPHLHATTSPTQQPKKVKITKAKAVVGRSETTVMEAEQTEIPIVLCFSGFKRGTIGYEPKDKVSMAQQARTVLGASVLGSYNQTCTHLVCPPKTRTMQTLQAVLEGSWVGRKDWLMASLATRRQLPTAGYG